MTRIAIVGAGPCGLSQMQAFRSAQANGAEIPEIVCFEKQNDWGGLWNYSWRTGTDEYGETCHGSMYKYLWSNGPKECLEFGDYSFEEHFGRSIPSFPPRQTLRDYITGRAEHAGFRDWVKFGHVVRDVKYIKDTKQFLVRAVDLLNQKDAEELFDYVVVANGHFSVPNLPTFVGIDNFPGRVIHGHDFRDAAEFQGQRLLIVGASYSAEDIALQSKKYGATSVTCSYRTAPMGFDWPDGIEELPLIDHFDGETAHFSNDVKRDFDSIILCTGYLHHFPFLAEELRLITTNRLYPGKLYKGIFWADNPKLVYLGMQDQYYTFSMFDAQAWYARDVVMDRIKLPSYSEMQSDIDKWQQREESLTNPSEDIDFQTDYCKDLSTRVDYSLDWDLAAQNFKDWEHHKEESIIGYRDKAFRSPVTHAHAPTHHTAWWEEMNDSTEMFLS